MTVNRSSDFITRNCEFISHNFWKKSQNCEFLSRNCDFINRNSDIITHNCEFLSHNSVKKNQNFEKKISSFYYIFIQWQKRASIVLSHEPNQKVIFTVILPPRVLLFNTFKLK